MKTYLLIKNILDFVGALGLILLFSPLFLLIPILIKLDSKGPVLFTQRRIGKDGSEFSMYKFRTMDVKAPKDLPTHLFSDAENHITRVGCFLRKSSLDEIPQFFNVLKRDMSFIGPRPALWNQYDLMDARRKSKADVLRPGITGLAQVNGRDELPIEKKAELDGLYANKLSFFLDLFILMKTASLVFTGKGVSEGGPK